MVSSSLNFIGNGGFDAPNENAAIDVVFVHGLGGDPTKTWAAGDDPADFWPAWLAADFPQINVWAAGYDSAVFSNALAGEGSSLADCSSILRDFLLSKDLGKRPTLFITHSLGGLIVKQMLRRCSDSADQSCKALLAASKGVVFLATPHYGADIASTICALLRVIASRHIQQLALNDEYLLDLNNWFKNWACSGQVSVAAYYETDKTSGIKVVTKVSADPNVLGCDPVAIKGDHIQICKPDTHEAQLYTSITALIRRLLSSIPVAAITPPSPEIPPQTTGTSLILSDSRGTRLLARVSAEPTDFFNSPQRQEIAIHREQNMSEVPAADAVALAPELLVDYEYFTTTAPHDRRPLAQKLEEGGRGREVNDAKRKKERFAMSLRKHSAQASSLGRYTRLMSDVESRFQRQVQPSINAGASTVEINRLVQETVIDPALRLQLEETHDATAALIESALYYLTGNCHVRWDADEN